MTHLVVLLVSLLTSVAVLGLLSLGLAIVYTTRGVINLAHGEFVMLGAYTAVTMTNRGVPFVVTLLAAAILVACMAGVIDVTLIRRLDQRPTDCMLATWGVSLILAQVVVLVFGTTTEGLSIPLGSLSLGTYTVSTYSLVLIGSFAISLILLTLSLRRSRLGLFIRAASQSEVDANGLGVNTRRVKTLAFAGSGAFTGFAGGLLAPFLGVSPNMGQNFIAEAFMTVIVGGPDAVIGTAAAALTLGGTDNILSTWHSPLVGQLGLLLLAIIVVRFAPRGLTGHRR